MNNSSIYQSKFQQKLFDAIAKNYDSVNFIFSFGIEHQIRKDFIHSIDIEPKEIRILDLMCGTGENWKYILQKFPDAKITALDFSEKMIDKAKHRNSKFFNNKIQLINADFFEWKNSTKPFDVIICGFGIKCIHPEQYELLAIKINNLLNEKGKFIYVDISKTESRLFNKFIAIYLKFFIPNIAALFTSDKKNFENLYSFWLQYDNGIVFNQMLTQSKFECKTLEFKWRLFKGVIASKI